MKIGTQTASLQNHLYSRMVIGQPDVDINMPATLLSWTDRYAATVTSVAKKAGKVTMIGVKRDKATRADKNGVSECQEYTFECDDSGTPYYFRQNKAGMWEEIALNKDSGRWVKTGGYGLRIGQRAEYRDPCF